ncbi:MAG: DUF3795 domain-containing protein [Chloroflexota bacterium]|nr:DUF3795 domain-containing protein [Chloroflexota bacterium]
MAACGLQLNDKNMVPMPAACGIDCQTCGLYDNCGGCPSGTDPSAPQRSEHIKEIMGAYCPALKCAIEKKVEYCLSCKEFPCEVHYKWEIPYSKKILDLHKKFKEQIGKE